EGQSPCPSPLTCGVNGRALSRRPLLPPQPIPKNASAAFLRARGEVTVDAAAFAAEQQRLKQFCVAPDWSLLVIRDCSSDPKPGGLFARLLLWILHADPRRLADPDDDGETGPWFVALPPGPASRKGRRMVLKKPGFAIVHLGLAEGLQQMLPPRCALDVGAEL